MLIIGLTGGIGSGKTEVSNLFAKLGVPIIDADSIAKKTTEPDQLAYKEIINHFPHPITLANGLLDRAKIREIIFNDPQERIWLEKLLHPLIRQKIVDEVSKLKSLYCIVVIPLLVESNSYSFINRILVVDTEPTLQVERVKTRDNVSATEVKAIVDTQIGREDRLNAAHDIILNNGTFENLVNQVKELDQFYTQLAKKSS